MSLSSGKAWLKKEYKIERLLETYITAQEPIQQQRK